MAQRAAAARLKNERTERWLVSTLGKPLLDDCRQYDAASHRKGADSSTEDPVSLENALVEAFRRNGLRLQHINPVSGFVLTHYYYLVALAAFNAAKSDGSS